MTTEGRASFWGLRPCGGWSHSFAREAVVSWLLQGGDKSHDAMMPQGDRSNDESYVVLLSYTQGRTIGLRGNDLEKYHDYLVNEIIKSLIEIESSAGDGSSSCCFLWLDKFARKQMATDQASWNGLTSILYSKYPVLVVTCCQHTTNNGEDSKVEFSQGGVGCTDLTRLRVAAVSALPPSLQRDCYLNAALFFRGWPWLERTLALRGEGVILSPATRQALQLESTLLLASLWASDVLSMEQTYVKDEDDVSWPQMSRLWQRLSWPNVADKDQDENDDDTISRHFAPALDALTIVQWDKNELVALMQFELVYASRQGVMPATSRAVAHVLSLLAGERISYDEQCDLTSAITRGGLGQSDIYDKFDWLRALDVQQDLRHNTNFQSDCFSNPHAWLQKCFESYLHEVAKGLVRDSDQGQAVALLEEWYKCRATPDCFAPKTGKNCLVSCRCCYDSESIDSVSQDPLLTIMRGVWRVVPSQDQVGMVGVFTPFLADKVTAAQVASVMGGWGEGLNALRRIGMNVLAGLPWSRHAITTSALDEDVCRSCGKHPDDHKVWLFGWRHVETDDAFAEIALAIVGLDRPRICAAIQDITVLQPTIRDDNILPIILEVGFPQWTLESKDFPMSAIIWLKPEAFAPGGTPPDFPI